MVNTKNNNLVLNTPPSTDPIQAALPAIQETLANIQAEVRAHSTDIASLKRGEGTSQPRRTDEMTVQPRPHPEPNNTPYGKLIRIEFLKFSGDDVKDWVYMKKYPDNTLWEHFEVEVVKRFRVLYENPIMELKNLKQTGSVQTYQEAFEALLNRAVTTPVKSSSVGQSSGYVTRNRVHKPYRLTQRELKDKRAKGQCFYYDQKYAPDFKWSFQNEVFTSDVMLLPLGGCEMVLGIQWLATLGDMQCNFKKLIMKFNHKGRQLVLRGMNNTHVHWMQGKEGMLKQAELSSMALCVYPVQLCQMESVESVSAEVEQVLT
ncbi:hypothetical protein Tco_1142557 [Tanacetum coccineum]